jgi:hypothetical protein
MMPADGMIAALGNEREFGTNALSLYGGRGRMTKASATAAVGRVL